MRKIWTFDLTIFEYFLIFRNQNDTRSIFNLKNAENRRRVFVFQINGVHGDMYIC